jgi:hypothetical protein
MISNNFNTNHSNSHFRDHQLRDRIEEVIFTSIIGSATDSVVQSVIEDVSQIQSVIEDLSQIQPVIWSSNTLIEKLPHIFPENVIGKRPVLNKISNGNGNDNGNPSMMDKYLGGVLVRLFLLRKDTLLKILLDFDINVFVDFERELIERLHNLWYSIYRKALQKHKTIKDMKKSLNNIFSDENISKFDCRSCIRNDRVSKKITRSDIQYMIENELLLPGNLIGVTRCNSSFWMFVLGTGLVLMYDPELNSIYLLNREGALQHFFKVSLIHEPKLSEVFDTCDFMSAHLNIYQSNQNINFSSFEKLTSELMLSQIPREDLVKWCVIKYMPDKIQYDIIEDQLFEPYYSDDEESEESEEYKSKEEFWFVLV